MIMFLISKWYKVSLQDLEVANKALEDEVTKNRARAGLHHFLKGAGLKDTYNQASTREKDNYFRHWFASEMATGSGCKAAKAQRKLVITGETNKEEVLVAVQTHRRVRQGESAVEDRRPGSSA